MQSWLLGLRKQSDERQGHSNGVVKAQINFWVGGALRREWDMRNWWCSSARNSGHKFTYFINLGNLEPFPDYPCSIDSEQTSNPWAFVVV